jgi:hypothetical protein
MTKRDDQGRGATSPLASEHEITGVIEHQVCVWCSCPTPRLAETGPTTATRLAPSEQFAAAEVDQGLGAWATARAAQAPADWRARRAHRPGSGDRAVAGVALGGDEVGCGVAAAAAAEAVGARPAGEPVAAAAASQAVVARAARQDVAAAVAAQQVVAVPASERVVVALGKDQVGARAAGQRVLAGAADPYRNLDRAGGLPVADSDGQDRAAAASELWSEPVDEPFA